MRLMPNVLNRRLKMLKFLRSLFTWTPKQYTFCYCPKCGNELCGSRDYLDKTSYVDHFSDNTVHYICVMCENESRWDLDTPFPIYLESLCDTGQWHIRKTGGGIDG